MGLSRLVTFIQVSPLVLRGSPSRLDLPTSVALQLRCIRGGDALVRIGDLFKVVEVVQLSHCLVRPNWGSSRRVSFILLHLLRGPDLATDCRLVIHESVLRLQLQVHFLS